MRRVVTGPGRIARRCIAGIERYRRSELAHRFHGCRFEPTCSRFAEDALRTRALPVALVASAWRIVRCNLLLTRRVSDPVRRDRRLRPRPNAVATVFAALATVGLVFIFGTELVHAQSVSGGCDATANGRNPTTMTKSDPLVVHKGETVGVSGIVPPAVASGGGEITSNTKIKISIVEGLIEPSYEQHPGTGPQWGGDVDVDNYLKYGVGLYKVEGSSSGSPGWSCSGSGYVKLEDGSPLGKPVGQVAAGLAVLGTAGAVLSSGLGRKAPKLAPGPTAEEVKADFASDAERVLGVEDKPAPVGPDEVYPDYPFDFGLTGGCLLVVLIIMGLYYSQAGAAFAVPAAGAAGAARPKAPRVWVKGHPVLGFFSGLVAGLGLTVLMQQYAKWPLTIATLIVFPFLVAILTTLRAARGKPFKAA